jgi:hypothetical protein
MGPSESLPRVEQFMAVQTDVLRCLAMAHIDFVAMGAPPVGGSSAAGAGDRPHTDVVCPTLDAKAIGAQTREVDGRGRGCGEA